MNKLEYVRVEFIEEWLGNKPPLKMTLIKQKALELKERGIVIILDSEIENKSFDEPPKNKMIKISPVKKEKSDKGKK